MDKFPYLNSHTEPWLSFGSTFLDMDTSYTLFSIVVLLLIYLWYLILTLFLQSPWKRQDIRKRQSRAKEGRKHRVKGQRTSQRRTSQTKAEGRRLWSILYRPLGKPYDLTHFRQLLCPDPLCDICNRETAEVSRLLLKVSRDNGDAASVSCLAPTAVVTETSSALSSALSESPPGHPLPVPLPECSPPSPSALSPNQAAPLEELLPPTQVSNSRPPESQCPLNSTLSMDSNPLQLHASLPPLPQHAVKKPDSVLQSEATLPLVGRPCPLSINILTTRSTDSARHAISEPALGQSSEDNPSPLKLAPSVLQELPDDLSSETSSWHDARACPEEPGIPFLPSPDDLTLREGPDGGTADVLALKEEEKKTKSFSKALTPPGKSLGSDAEPQDLAVSCPARTKRFKPEKLHVSWKHPDPKTSEDQREQKCIQVFWALSSLDSAVLKPEVPISDLPKSVCFNQTFHAPVRTHPTPLSSSESQPETMLQTGSQSETQLVPPTKAQGQPQPSVQVLPSSLLCSLPITGVSYHKPQHEKEPLMPSQIQRLEQHILRKRVERLWGLPSVVTRSQRELCPPAPKLSLVSHTSKAHDTRPILPGDFPLTSELQKKLECHLRKMLVQHRWGLPHRIQNCVSLMKPQAATPKPPESTRSPGLPRISSLQGQSCTDLHCELSPQRSLQERRSETLPVEEEAPKEQGHSAEVSHKHPLSRDLEVGPGNGVQGDSHPDLDTRTGRLPGKSSKDSGVLPQRELEDTLKAQLSRIIKQFQEGQIPAMVRRSWSSTTATLPQPAKCLSQRKDLPQRMGTGSQGNVAQDVVPPWPSKGEMLEEHIRQFCRRMMYGLPADLQESIVKYSLRGNPAQSYPHFLLTSSTSLTAQVDGKPGRSKTLKEKSNIHGRDKMGMAKSATSEHPMTTGRVLKGTSAPQEHKTYAPKSQAARELYFPRNDRQYMSLASNKSKYAPPVTIGDQAPSSGDTTASPVPSAHFSKLEVSMGQGQEPWIPAHVLDKGLNKNFLRAEKRECPMAPGPDRGHATLATKQPRRKSHPTQTRPTKGICGNKSSTALSMKGQPPPQNHGRNQVKHFFRWLCPGKKCKSPERSPEKCTSSSSSLQGSGLHKGSAVFPENTSAHRAIRHADKTFKGNPGCRHGARDITCPKGPPFPTSSGKFQHKPELCAEAESVHIHHLHCQATLSKVPSVPSTSQVATSAGQKRRTGHRDRQPQKDMDSQEKLVFQKYPSIHAPQGAEAATKRTHPVPSACSDTSSLPSIH